jgi:hypothetical protein
MATMSPLDQMECGCRPLVHTTEHLIGRLTRIGSRQTAMLGSTLGHNAATGEEWLALVTERAQTRQGRLVQIDFASLGA